MNLPAPTDWSREIDASFGRGCDRPAEAYADLGRRTLRRRRRTHASLAALTVAAMAVAGLWGSTLGGDPSTPSPGVAVGPANAPDQPTEEPTETGHPDLAPMARTVDDVSLVARGATPKFIPAAATENGGLAVVRGWTVSRLVVLTDTDTDRQWGLVVTSPDGTRLWVLAEWSYGEVDGEASGQRFTTTGLPGVRFASFDEWLVDMVDTQARGPAGQEEAVAIVTGGEMVPLNGAEVLVQQSAPDTWSAYGPVEEQYAVKLRTADGRTWFARVDTAGSTTVDPDVLDSPTMEAFVDHVAAQGDGGEGLR